MSKKSPQLRFEGFTDDWEERRLSEVLRERNNQQPQSMEYPLVSFTVENGVTPKTDRYEREQLVVGDKSSKKYKVTVLNDIVYNPANLKFGAISRNKYGNAVFSPIYVTFSVNNDVTMPEFIEMLITRKDFIKRALKYQQGTVYERQSVSPENLLSMNLYLPGKLEQEKIGTFFKHLDDTISLQQRKLDLLKEQKKGYLQKMFPKNGEKIPELRFAGFVDDWEQRKLSDLMTFSNGINAPKENYGKGTKMISVMDILNPLPIKYDNILNSVSVDKKIEDKNKVENGDLIFVRSSEIVEEVGWAKAYKEARYALYSGFAIRGKRISSYNAYFIELTLNYANRKEIKRRAGGSTRFNVSQEILNSLTVLTPSISEQNQIDLFFTKIDDTITLHQRKLDLLKEQKKGFLQKMFV